MRFLSLGLFFYLFLCACSNNTLLHYSLDDFYEDDFTVYDSSEFPLRGTGRRVQRFVLGGEKTKVDMLVGVDTSPSTYRYIEEIGSKSQDLFYHIDIFDWQMGFISTDHGDHSNPSGRQESWRDHITASRGAFGNLMSLEDGRGKLLRTRVLIPRMRDYRDIFFHTVSHYPEINCDRPPYCQGGLEQPLRSFKSAMERVVLHNSSNSLLFRADSQALVFLLLGMNEEERSEDKGRATKVSQVIRTFKLLRSYLNNPNKRLFVYSIGIFRGNCLREQQRYSEHAEIAKTIGYLADDEFVEGANISLCHKNYGQALREISYHIKSSLENSVVLQTEPIPKTVRVHFPGTVRLKWEVEGQKVIFKNRISDEPLQLSVSYIPKAPPGV